MKRSGTFLWTRLLGFVLLSFLLTKPAWACPVCYGVSDASTIAGVNFAILALLGVTGSVLAGFASFFLYIRKRSRMVLNGSVHSPSKN
jgi:hypothetical protein